jgi:hypothetical protein
VTIHAALYQQSRVCRPGTVLRGKMEEEEQCINEEEEVDERTQIVQIITNDLKAIGQLFTKLKNVIKKDKAKVLYLFK